jgi:hypothetical protein
LFPIEIHHVKKNIYIILKKYIDNLAFIIEMPWVIFSSCYNWPLTLIPSMPPDYPATCHEQTNELTWCLFFSSQLILWPHLMAAASPWVLESGPLTPVQWEKIDTGSLAEIFFIEQYIVLPSKDCPDPLAQPVLLNPCYNYITWWVFQDKDNICVYFIYLLLVFKKISYHNWRAGSWSETKTFYSTELIHNLYKAIHLYSKRLLYNSPIHL